MEMEYEINVTFCDDQADGCIGETETWYVYSFERLVKFVSKFFERENKKCPSPNFVNGRWTASCGHSFVVDAYEVGV